jgi:hypothetical protein
MGMLTLSLAQGEGFWLLKAGHQDRRWELDEVFLSKGFTVKSDDGKVQEVRPEEELELAHDVWISDGDRLIVGRARIVLNAPMDVKILRDALYEERKRKVAA